MAARIASRPRMIVDAGFLHVGHNGSVEPIRIGGFSHIAEAHDIQPDRSQTFQFRFAIDARREILRDIATLLHDGADRVGAIDLQRHPHLQSAEATGQVRTEIAGPDAAPAKTTRLMPQAGRIASECRQMESGIAHHDAAGIVRCLRPLVEIERHRVRLFDPAQPRTQ
jgi:hypothetical protein